MEGIEIIKNNPILQSAFRFIIKNSTSNYIPYHNLNHLLTVLKYSEFIAKGEGIYFDRRLPLHLAALFHDVDHLGGKQKDDDENIERAIKAFTMFVETSGKITLDVANKVILIIEADDYNRFECLMIDLFPCNRRPYAGWKNKEVTVNDLPTPEAMGWASTHHAQPNGSH